MATGQTDFLIPQKASNYDKTDMDNNRDTDNEVTKEAVTEARQSDGQTHCQRDRRKDTQSGGREVNNVGLSAETVNVQIILAHRKTTMQGDEVVYSLSLTPTHPRTLAADLLTRMTHPQR